MTNHRKVKLISEKGTYILYNSVKKYLDNKNLEYNIINNDFNIKLLINYILSFNHSYVLLKPSFNFTFGL